MIIPFLETGRIVLRIPLHLIDSNPAQPRKYFEAKDIAGLADSIARNGLLNPISARKCKNGRYELIAGERRLMAFRLLGEKSIPTLLDTVDDHTSAVLALVENLQRRDLSFLEEAMALSQLLEHEDMTQLQLGESLGMSQSSVANKLRILKLPPTLLEQLQRAGLTERHARALLPLCEDVRLQNVAHRVIESQLTVARTEQLVSEIMSFVPKRGKRLLILKDLRLFTSTIQRAVSVMQEAGIQAVTQKCENDESITYTIVIPKSVAKHRPLLDKPKAI